jgi:S-adenosyl-L-methionine hydrolase (adenosine-forming)
LLTFEPYKIGLFLAQNLFSKEKTAICFCPMSIVTLTSDWNQDDFYTAALQGRILSRCPGAIVVTITNQVPAFNIAIAAFQLKHACGHFPEGTIHIIAVNGEMKEKRPCVALKSKGQYFIGFDNGIFGLLMDEEPQEVVTIADKNSSSFPELTLFAEAACDIIIAEGLSNLGADYSRLYKQVPMLPTIDESVISGSIIYIDSYRNAFTNISHELFNQIGKGRPFEIFVQSNHNKIDRLNEWYGESSLGEMLALFNSLGLLEIAINGGNAADLLNLSLNSSVRVKFREIN